MKCADRLGREHTAQCLNYLKASGKQLCLLVNFQNPRVEWQRVVWRFGWDEEKAEKADRPLMNADKKVREDERGASAFHQPGSLALSALS